MAIRRKVRTRGKEPVSRINPLQTEKVQKNMERLNQIVHATSTRTADAAPISVPFNAPISPTAAGPAYAPRPSAPSVNPAADSTAPDPIYVPDPEKIMSQVDEDLRASMQQAQEAIKHAEALLLHSEESTDDSVLEAQRIAERAVADAISQTDAMLKPILQAPPPQAPQLAPNDPSANREVQ
jgi:hypothetical protein